MKKKIPGTIYKPSNTNRLYIKYRSVRYATGLMNLKKLIEESGLNYQKMMSKLQRGTELNVEESQKIQNILNKIKALV